MIQLTEHEAAVLSNVLARSQAASNVQPVKTNTRANQQQVEQKKVLKVLEKHLGKGFTQFVK